LEAENCLGSGSIHDYRLESSLHKGSCGVQDQRTRFSELAAMYAESAIGIGAIIEIATLDRLLRANAAELVVRSLTAFSPSCVVHRDRQ
jgi:hypothetical protein